MPPSDDLDLDPGTATPPADAAVATPAEAAAPAASVEQLREALGSAIQQAQGPLAEQLQALDGRLGQIESRIPTAEPSQAPVTTDDLATELLTDPKATLDKYLGSWAEENLGPALSRDYAVRRDERVSERAAKFDERFGEGSFEKFIKPTVVGDRANPGTLAAYAANHQADPQVIDACIAAAVGNLEMGNNTDWTQAKETAVKKSRERQIGAPPASLAPGGRAAPITRLTPDMERGLNLLQDHGYDVDKNTILGAAGNAMTIEQWQASQPKKAAAGAGGAQ